MVEEEDEGISIERLIGERCVLNDTVTLTLSKNEKRAGRLELAALGDTQITLVESVDEMCADGGFVVTIRLLGSSHTHRVRLITSSLFAQHAKEGYKTQRRPTL